MKVIRGAICAENTAESISNASLQLVQEIMVRNNLSANDVLYVFFTATADLNAVYPAKAVREDLLPNACFNCAQEMHVAGSLKKCLRVAVFVATDKTAVKHCYLGEASCLRTDL